MPLSTSSLNKMDAPNLEDEMELINSEMAAATDLMNMVTDPETARMLRQKTTMWKDEIVFSSLSNEGTAGGADASVRLGLTRKMQKVNQLVRDKQDMFGAASSVSAWDKFIERLLSVSSTNDLNDVLNLHAQTQPEVVRKPRVKKIKPPPIPPPPKLDIEDDYMEEDMDLMNENTPAQLEAPHAFISPAPRSPPRRSNAGGSGRKKGGVYDNTPEDIRRSRER